jgi:phosphoribosyl 1,2-cyclic phosphodiesterase
MGSPFRVSFLGTGGGRFVMITQKRRTAGIRIIGEAVNLHLDPGPGALVHSIDEGLDPGKIRAVLVSHCHPDHYTDAEVFVEAMTRGMTRKQGLLAAPKSVLEGGDACEVSISNYHQRMVEQRIEAKPGVHFRVGTMDVLTTQARHTDPGAVGFRFKTGSGDFAYTSDTEYFDGMVEYYGDLRLLVLCVMRPSGKPWKGHMSTDDAIRIISETRPERAIMTHLGMSMLLQGPETEAKIVQDKTGVPTLAAVDGMCIDFSESIEVSVGKGKAQRDLVGFL